MKGFMESFNHPFGKEACKKRLLEEYKKYGKLIVAFDYDNTIFDYHNNGGDYSCVIELLKRCARLGLNWYYLLVMKILVNHIESLP